MRLQTVNVLSLVLTKKASKKTTLFYACICQGAECVDGLAIDTAAIYWLLQNESHCRKDDGPGNRSRYCKYKFRISWALSRNSSWRAMKGLCLKLAV